MKVVTEGHTVDTIVDCMSCEAVDREVLQTGSSEPGTLTHVQWAEIQHHIEATGHEVMVILAERRIRYFGKEPG